MCARRGQCVPEEVVDWGRGEIGGGRAGNGSEDWGRCLE